VSMEVIDANPLAPGLYGLGLAAAVAALGLIEAAVVRRRDDPRSARGRWGVALSLGLGYMAAHAWVRGWLRPLAWPPLPALDAFDWLFYVALAGMLLGLFEAVRPTPGWARWENRLILVGGTLWALLGSKARESWDLQLSATTLGPIGAGMLLSWGTLEGMAERRGRSILLPMLVVAGGLTAALLITHSLVLAGLGLAVVGPLAVAWLFGWFSPCLTLGRGAVPALTLLLWSLGICGVFYSDLPATSALGFAVAPLMIGIDRVGPFRKWRPWRSASLRAVAVAVPVALAVTVAFRASLTMSSESGPPPDPTATEPIKDP